MVAESRTWVDIEKALREWLKDALTGMGRRVFFASPSNAVMPQVVLFRIAGPDDECLMQFDVWGSSKVQAAQAAAQLATTLDGLTRFEFEGVLLMGADVQSISWTPDEESTTPRYIVQALITAYAGS